LGEDSRNKCDPRQRAAGASLCLAVVIFIVVMLATLGVVAFGAIRSGATNSLQDSLPTLLIVAVVVVEVILVGVLTSLRYMTAARVKQISVASGLAQVGKVREDGSYFEFKFGKTRLRLLTVEHLEAFQPGVAYRVHYLAGAVPFILSAEWRVAKPKTMRWRTWRSPRRSKRMGWCDCSTALARFCTCWQLWWWASPIGVCHGGSVTPPALGSVDCCPGWFRRLRLLGRATGFALAGAEFGGQL